MKEEITVFGEWLTLPKDEFGILILLSTTNNEFKGTLSDLCRALNLSTQTNNRNKIMLSLKKLYSEGYIIQKNSGRKLLLKIIPNGTEIKIYGDLTRSIIKHEYSSKPVAWEQVLKVYIWDTQNDNQLVTNKKIADALSVSESVVSYAHHVLLHDYNAIQVTKITEKIAEDEYKSLGHTTTINALYNIPKHN